MVATVTGFLHQLQEPEGCQLLRNAGELVPIQIPETMRAEGERAGEIRYIHNKGVDITTANRKFGSQLGEVAGQTAGQSLEVLVAAAHH